MRLALLLFLLALFDPTRGWAGNRFHERNHTGLLTLFGFDDGQRSSDLHPTSARDYTGLGLLGNLTTSTSAIVWSADRAGFTVPASSGGSRVTSMQSSNDVLSRLTTEVSVEFFISAPTNPSLQYLFIAGFGEWPPGSPFPVCTSDQSTTEGGWRLFQADGDGIAVQLVVSNNGAPTCVHLGFVNVANSLRHVVFRGRPGEISLVSHGTIDRIPNPAISFNASHWARNPSHLTFALPQPMEGWIGTIFMTAIHNRYLSDAEVAQNRIYGPPNSLPVASAAASPIATTEDVTMTLYP